MNTFLYISKIEIEKHLATDVTLLMSHHFTLTYFMKKA